MPGAHRVEPVGTGDLVPPGHLDCRVTTKEPTVTRVSRPHGTSPRRVAVLSVHTSPLHQPGTGDAGGMNVYIVEVARRLAEAGVEVEVFTRATSRDLPPCVEMAPGVLVRHVIAGPL